MGRRHQDHLRLLSGTRVLSKTAWCFGTAKEAGDPPGAKSRCDHRVHATSLVEESLQVASLQLDR